MHRSLAAVVAVLLFVLLDSNLLLAQQNLQKVNHIIIVMQENHSFDNYFGVLPYVPGGPYHSGPCAQDDHQCVDGLICTISSTGALTCSNSNPDDDGSPVPAFHEPSRCVAPDLGHSWFGTHREGNFAAPNNTLTDFLGDGFIRVNDLTEQIDNGAENPTEDQTIGFYNQADIPFYYDLAAKFAISDRHFASVLGPLFPTVLT